MKRHRIATMAAAAMLGAGGMLTPVAESEPRRPEPEPDPKPKAKTPVIGGKIPDRVSLEDDSPFYFPHWRKIGVRHNGGECNTVVEFCVSEGWLRAQIFHGGRPKTERGRFVTVTRRGTIEPYWRS